MFAPHIGEIKRGATKRGGSATVAHAGHPPNSNGGRRCRRPPLSLCRNLAWEARRPASGGFEWRRLNRGSWRRFLRGPFPAEAGAGFPAGSPTRAEALAVRHSAVRNSRPSSPHRSPSAEASDPLMAGSSAEASGSAWRPWTEILGPPVSQLPGRSPVLPGQSAPKRLPFRWRRRNRSSAFRRAGPGSEDPVFPPDGFPRARRPLGNRWALYEACRFRIR